MGYRQLHWYNQVALSAAQALAFAIDRRIRGQHGEVAGAIAQGQGSVEIIYYNQRPLVRLRSLFCLVQCSSPLLSGVILGARLCKDSVSDLEGAVGWAMITSCIASAVKLLHYWGFADWAKEGPGHLSTYIPLTGLPSPIKR